MSYKKTKSGGYKLEGFNISKKDVEKLRKLTNNANSKRNRLANKYYDDVSKSNALIGISQKEYTRKLEEKGFITEKLSSRLTQFKSKEEFKEHLKDLEEINKPYYNKKKVRKLRHSMEVNAYRNLSNDGKSVKDKLRQLTDSELVATYINDDNIVAEIYGSDGSIDDIDERIESTNTRIDYIISKVRKVNKKGKRK